MPRDKYTALEELKSALVIDKVGFVINRIELLAFRTTFNPDDRSGDIIINVSLFSRDNIRDAIKAMSPAFKSSLCVSKLVALRNEGERLGHITVPTGMVGMATVCSITINGVLLKAGVPMGSRFGGILELRQSLPHRFVELINYEGSTLDPSEIFVRARMTAVRDLLEGGSGKVLASFRELPSPCAAIVTEVLDKLRVAGLKGVVIMGNTGEPVCEIPVEMERIGIVLYGGLNPVAAAAEADIQAANFAMSTMMDYEKLINYKEALV